MKEKSKHRYSLLFFLFITPSFFCALVLFQWIYGEMIVGHLAWKVGIALAFLLTLSIGYLTFGEIYRTVGRLSLQEREQARQLQERSKKFAELEALCREKIAQLESVLQEERKREIAALNTKELLIEVAREEAATLLQEKNALYERVFDYERSLAEALSLLREEKFQTYLLKDEVAAAPDPLIHEHRQLRAQFEEKKAKLEEMKRALFSLEEELLLLKKERVVEKLQEETSLVDELIEENAALVKENQNLEEIITASLPAPIKSLKKKSSLPSQTQLEPEFDLIFS